MTHPADAPVPVHITGVSAEVHLGAGAAPAPAARRQLRTEFTTVELDTTNSCQPLLAADSSRVQAIILVRAAAGTADASTSYGWLGDSKEQAQTGARTQKAGGYITADSPLAIPPILGQGAVWAALDAGATTGLTLTVIADYEV